MTRDDMYNLIMGAAVIAIGYMLWKQHKGQGTAPRPGRPSACRRPSK